MRILVPIGPFTGCQFSLESFIRETIIGRSPKLVPKGDATLDLGTSGTPDVDVDIPRRRAEHPMPEFRTRSS
jgi:hypothetical protein